MTATDAGGIAHSYLNTEDNFRFMKDIETEISSCRSSAISSGRKRFEPSAAT